MDFRSTQYKINSVIDKSDQLKQYEQELIQLLLEVDRRRLFVFSGYKSLSGFCTNVLKITETQTQRLVTQVRRYEPTPQIGKKSEKLSN